MWMRCNRDQDLYVLTLPFLCYHDGDQPIDSEVGGGIVSQPAPSPTVVHDIQFHCAGFTVSGTNFASVNAALCRFYVVPGDVLTVSSCGTGYGDSFFILYASNSTLINQVVVQDNGCSGGSAIGTTFTYMVPSDSLSPLYTLAQGCYDAATCSGTT